MRHLISTCSLNQPFSTLYVESTLLPVGIALLTALMTLENIDIAAAENYLALWLSYKLFICPTTQILVLTVYKPHYDHEETIWFLSHSDSIRFFHATLTHTKYATLRLPTDYKQNLHIRRFRYFSTCESSKLHS